MILKYAEGALMAEFIKVKDLMRVRENLADLCAKFDDQGWNILEVVLRDFREEENDRREGNDKEMVDMMRQKIDGTRKTLMIAKI
jgi:glutathione peroxidase-family protein